MKQPPPRPASKRPPQAQQRRAGHPPPHHSPAGPRGLAASHPPSPVLALRPRPGPPSHLLGRSAANSAPPDSAIFAAPPPGPELGGGGGVAALKAQRREGGPGRCSAPSPGLAPPRSSRHSQRGAGHSPRGRGGMWGIRHRGPVMSLGGCCDPKDEGSGELCHDTGGCRGLS